MVVMSTMVCVELIGESSVVSVQLKSLCYDYFTSVMDLVFFTYILANSTLGLFLDKSLYCELVVAFSSRAKILRECSRINSPLSLFFFFFKLR